MNTSEDDNYDNDDDDNDDNDSDRQQLQSSRHQVEVDIVSVVECSSV